MNDLRRRFLERHSKETRQFLEICKARNEAEMLIRNERKEKDKEVAVSAITNNKMFGNGSRVSLLLCLDLYLLVLMLLTRGYSLKCTCRIPKFSISIQHW